MTFCTPTPIPSNLPVIEYSNYNSPHVILNGCLKFFGISNTMLKNKSREREVLKPRQLITYILCKHTDLTLSKIAEIVGYKDHTNVISTRNRVLLEIEINTYIEAQYYSLIKFLRL